MNSKHLLGFLEFARKMVYEAGELTLQYFQKDIHPENKKDGSPVTVADREAERLIRSGIEKKYPHHGILGEEFGMGESNSGTMYRWIIDPIDGTKSFIRGVPLYSILIGLEIEGKVEVGVAYFPALKEMVSAASGLGCWRNGKRAFVSNVTHLAQATITFTDCGAFNKQGEGEHFLRLADRAYYRPGWGDAYGFALVATGRAEVMIDPVMAVWDCGPFPPILQEAGGYFGDWQGLPTIYAGRALATSNLLLEEVLGALNNA
jgi:histidinol-phosphatase